MRLSKKIADICTREFRAAMNKAAQDGMPHERWHVFSPEEGSRKKKSIVAFRIVVDSDEGDMRDRLFGRNEES